MLTHSKVGKSWVCSSDLVIHSHLSAGTAAIECALEKIPTILIDREKILNSKLRELPKDEIYFDFLKSLIKENLN